VLEERALLVCINETCTRGKEREGEAKRWRLIDFIIGEVIVGPVITVNHRREFIEPASLLTRDDFAKAATL